MKRMKIMGLALVAVFALVAIAASSASAAGYFGCVKQPVKTEGKFAKGCAAAGTGYEIAPSVGKGKASKSKGGPANLVVVVPPGVSKEFPEGATIHIECASNKGVSTSTLPNKVSKAVTTFSKCKVLGAPCQSGTKKETIVTNSLSGELIDIEGGSGVGTELGAEPPGKSSASFVCTEVAETNVLGSLIGVNAGNVGAGNFNKNSTLAFNVGPGLGEVEFAPGHKYTPLVNIPTHQTGGFNGEHFLNSEISKEKVLTGTLPSGQTQEVTVKGEDVEILP
jgi:hypothetical protein